MLSPIAATTPTTVLHQAGINCGERTTGNDLKSEQGRFSLDIRKNFQESGKTPEQVA